MKKDQKQLVIEQLKKTPIVQIACEKLGVSRATYYRWGKEDPHFREETKRALREGELLINDLAETQLLTAIKNNDFAAVRYWLNHHHPTYATKVEIKTSESDVEELTPEQQAVVKRALEMMQNYGIAENK